VLIVVGGWSALFDVVGALCCQVAWLHKNDIFAGVLRAQRFEHATSYEPSPEFVHASRGAASLGTYYGAAPTANTPSVTQKL
jgi:hypothetical protein